MGLPSQGRGHRPAWLLRFAGIGVSFSGGGEPKLGFWHVWSACGPRWVGTGRSKFVGKTVSNAWESVSLWSWDPIRRDEWYGGGRSGAGL